MRVLILRKVGGLGDLLVHRMIFHTVKEAYGGELHIACPVQYHEALSDHPALDGIHRETDWEHLQPDLVFDTTSACLFHERRHPANRSDIWAETCGVFLKEHEMDFHLSQEEIDFGKQKIGSDTILISPKSATYRKSLTSQQMLHLAEQLPTALFLHHEKMPLPVPQLTGLSVRQFFGVVNAANKILTVDTSTFHLAGGLKKPMVALHSMYNGKTIGKYYKQRLLQSTSIMDFTTKQLVEEIEALS